VASEDEIRLGVFLATFVFVATWEILAPRRQLNYSRRIRWLSNIGLSVLNQLLTRLFFPVLLFGLAVELQQRGWGLFNFFDIPGVLAVVLCLLRLLVVTPDMHRVHHSAMVGETNSNFGFNLPWWDYLFGTYCEQPGRGHREMKLGLEEFPSEKQLAFTKLLVLPFQRR